MATRAAMSAYLTTLGFNTPAQRNAILDQGYDDLGTLHEMDGNMFKSIMKNVRDPRGTVANNPAAIAAGGPARLRAFGHQVTAMEELKLRKLLHYMHYIHNVQRPWVVATPLATLNRVWIGHPRDPPAAAVIVPIPTPLVKVTEIRHKMEELEDYLTHLSLIHI